MRFLFPEDPDFAPVAKLQARIRELQKELRQLETMPLPVNEVRSQIRGYLARQIKDRQIGFVAKSFTWPPRGSDVEKQFPAVDGPYQASFEAVSVGMLAAVIGLDELTDRMLAMACPDGYQEGLPAAERPAHKAKLLAQLRDLELEEERAILALEDSGLIPARRSDTSPDVLLECWSA